MEFLPHKIYWQAHRGGGGNEAPDNTLGAMEYGWELGGIPEADIRITRDHEVVCLHDNSLRRITDAPEEIADTEIKFLPFSLIRQFDAGKKFHPRFAGERVPALREVFSRMAKDPEKLLYTDIKNYDPELFPILLEKFAALVREYGVASQVICASCDYELNCQLHKKIPGIKTMQWIGGTPRERMETFMALAEKDFASLDLVQLHLYIAKEPEGDWIYDLSLKDLEKAFSLLGNHLEVFPFGAFTKEAIAALLNMGIKQFATDEPMRFAGILKELE